MAAKLQVSAALLLIAAGIVYWLMGDRADGLHAPAAQSRAADFAILPDIGSPPTLALCCVNSARRATLRNTDLVGQIVNALPPQVRMILLMNDPGAFTVASNPWPDRVTFLELPGEMAVTIWPQDPFIVLRDAQGKSRLLVSRHFDRADDRLVPQVVARFLGWERIESALSFEGGNLVADDALIFIGGNTVRLNAQQLNQSEDEIVRTFERELGRPVLVVGPVPQPIGHLDMMLTPLGENRLALADPSWGAKLAEAQLVDAPQEVEAFERQCEQVYFGRADIEELHDLAGKTIRRPQVVGRTRQAIAESAAAGPALDRLAADLGARGFIVERLPFLDLFATALADGSPPVSVSAVEKPLPEYPCLTYNNVLVETRDGRPTVYVPQYGWPAFDDAARAAWTKLGYQVRKVPGLTTSAMYGGSLRCCVKILERGAP